MILLSLNESVDVAPEPPFEAEQRPDQQTVVACCPGVLAQRLLHVGGVDDIVNARVSAAQQISDVLQTFTAEPARIRSTEALLDPGGYLRRHDTLHRIP